MADSQDRIPRRRALALVGGGLVAAHSLGCSAPTPTPSAAPLPPSPQKAPMSHTTTAQPPTSAMPTVFVPHGGGPWPFVEVGFAGDEPHQRLRAYLAGIYRTLPRIPKAVIVVSAHWEAPEPTVMTHPQPPMLYDYSGFPKEAYALSWPAQGAVEVATRVQELLGAARFQTRVDPRRGYDHGTFVVTKLSDPEATIPTFQLSLKAGLDPVAHLQIGEALAPLRREGVLILGSGMSYHNMRGFGQAMRGNTRAVSDTSRAFDEWLCQAMTQDASARRQALAEWELAPSARACHPREEHLLPLMVVAGAGHDGTSATPFRATLMGAHISAFQFG